MNRFRMVIAIAAFSLLSVPVSPATAQVVGQKACGEYVNYAPSGIKMHGNSMVDMGLFLAAFKNFRDAVACLINAERTSRNLPALSQSKLLEKAASGHALDAARIRWWSNGANPHVNPQTGSTIDSRIKAVGYCGGNIKRDSEIAHTGWGAGMGTTPYGAVDWWMNVSKSGHREAILDPNVTELGVGVTSPSADGSAPAGVNMGTYVVDFGACN